MNPGLRHQRLWTGAGVVLVIGVIAGSLVAIPETMPLPGFDKTHHLLAYGTLMYWWGMLQPARRAPWAAGLVGMGMALEFLQSLTGYRTMEWQDAVANALGVILALGLLATPASRLLSWLDTQLGNRLHSRRS